MFGCHETHKSLLNEAYLRCLQQRVEEAGLVYAVRIAVVQVVELLQTTRSCG